MGVQTNEQLYGLPKRFKRKFLVYFLSIFFLFFVFFLFVFLLLLLFFPLTIMQVRKARYPIML